MAEIVLAVATSHSPQLTAPVDLWPLYADYDADGRHLIGPDRTPWDWQRLADHRDRDLDDVLTDTAWRATFGRCQAALDALADSISNAEPDVVIVIGDDQNEMFTDECLPTFGVYCGAVVRDEGESDDVVNAKHPLLAAAARAFHASEPEEYTVAADLGWHLLSSLCRSGFDVTRIGAQPGGRGLGHAFTFPRRRLLNGGLPRVLPVFVNTYYPPNQPTPRRCIDFGRALAAGLASDSSTARVAMVASGGLSHLVIDEQLDRHVLDALEANDTERLAAIPPDALQTGTSEILNWITLGGAIERSGLTMELVDYVPAYRTRAGTGVGMAFARWQPH